MSQLEPIPEEALAFAKRRMARKIAAAIVLAMAETDYSFAQIGPRVGRTEAQIADWMRKLFDGDGSGAAIDHVSDILLAMACELDFHIISAKPIPCPKPTADQPAT